MIDRMLEDGHLETVAEEGWGYFHVGSSEKERAPVGSGVGAGEI